MSSRIKYDFIENIGISRRTYKIGKKHLRIVLDRANFTFEIVDIDGVAVVSGGDTINYIVLMRQAKRALIKLGYSFKKETRRQPNVKTSYSIGESRFNDN